MDSNTAALVQTLVELVVGLAWPVVVLVLAFSFRSQIRALLGKLSRFKGLGVEAEFEKLAEAAATLPKVTAPGGGPGGPGVAGDAAVSVREPLTARLAGIAREEPVLAVITAYSEIEEVLRRRLREAQVTGVDRLFGERLIDVALSKGDISPESAEALRRSLDVRNLALRVDPVLFDTLRALQFLELSDSFIRAIESWPRNPDGTLVEP